MRVYTVHEARNSPSDRLDRAEALRFVRDGFSWRAALFAPIWLLLSGFWLAFVLYALVVAGLMVVVQALGLGEVARTLALVAIHLLIGCEADSIERWTLRRRGWRTIGTVSGRDAVECERRFFDAWLAEQPLIRPETLSVSQITGRADGASLGRPHPAPGRWRSAFPFFARQ